MKLHSILEGEQTILREHIIELGDEFGTHVMLNFLKV